MIKLKNLWKIALATMTMSAMLVACDTTSKEEEEEAVAPDYATMTFDSNVYVSGIFNKWAEATDFANSIAMTQNGNVYTYEFTYDSTADVIPYGFKFNTAKGWMEQYINADFGFEDVQKKIEFGKEYVVVKQGKIGLEWDYDGKKYSDDSTKFFLANKLVTGEKYTVTLNLDTMKVKFDGKAGESNKELTIADVKYIVGTVDNWSHTEMVDGKTYTFKATETGDARFKFSVGSWAFQAGSADVDTEGDAKDPAHRHTAADMGKEIEIKTSTNATAFIFPVEKDKEYIITLDVTQKFMKFEEKK